MNAMTNGFETYIEAARTRFGNVFTEQEPWLLCEGRSWGYTHVSLTKQRGTWVVESHYRPDAGAGTQTEIHVHRYATHAPAWRAVRQYFA